MPTGGSGGGPNDSGELIGLTRTGSFLVGGRSSSGRRGVLVALASTVVFFGAIGYLVLNSPGWPLFQQAFLNARFWNESWPRQLPAVVLNIQLFLMAEAFILPLALVIAVLRSLPGPIFFPLRLLAIIYTDFFRGVPGILIIFVLGFGMPALGVDWIPSDPFFWGLVSLVLLYTAYVSEVYRAGIESVHPSQEAAARSLGLNRFQALRFVVIPQAIRRVIPPLLNDFIGLQKDTALVGFLGVVEVFKKANIDEAGWFNFTPYLVTASLFLILTVPLARLTDWLLTRERRRQLAAIAR
jgi:polar amino acid transport system permease protein